jgi:aryl-alcohol dehydrogenase-like predicted oxidoreductase
VKLLAIPSLSSLSYWELMHLSDVRVPVRRLGPGGLKVSAEGLGCMGMSSQSYGAAEESASIETINRAIELGVFFLDTADVYGAGTPQGRGHNEELIGRVTAGRRDEVVIATKFGITERGGGKRADTVNGRPEYVKQCCEESLRRLGTDHIDLYYAHRVDPNVPVEDTVGAMAELVKDGKVLHLGLSEASAATLERAVAVHPIAALQSEWSLWTRDIEAEVLPTARRLGISLVPFSPLGRGIFTGALNSHKEGFAEGDFRRTNPRFQGEHFERNIALVGKLDELAAEKGVKPGQLALAWLLAQGDDVIPIPGTKRRVYLEENAGAAAVELSEADLARLDALSPPGGWSGDRYAHVSVYGDTPAPPTKGGTR